MRWLRFLHLDQRRPILALPPVSAEVDAQIARMEGRATAEGLIIGQLSEAAALSDEDAVCDAISAAFPPLGETLQPLRLTCNCGAPSHEVRVDSAAAQRLTNGWQALHPRPAHDPRWDYPLPQKALVEP